MVSLENSEIPIQFFNKQKEKISIFDIKKNDSVQLLIEYSAHGRWITGLSTYPNKNYFMTVGEDCYVNIWNISKYQQYSYHIKYQL